MWDFMELFFGRQSFRIFAEKRMVKIGKMRRLVHLSAGIYPKYETLPQDAQGVEHGLVTDEVIGGGVPEIAQLGREVLIGMPERDGHG